VTDFFFDPELNDSGGPTPLSWRFGQHRRWHASLDFLYEIRAQDGQLQWASCLKFTAEEETNLVLHPVPQNIKSPMKHSYDFCRTVSSEQVPTEPHRK
jgi:hypothetical protein